MTNSQHPLHNQASIGLALGGGAVLGAAHIGVLRALAEFDIRIDYVTGTSIGSLVGSLFACGKGWEAIGEVASELSWMDISKMTFSRSGLLSNEKLGGLVRKTIGERTFADTDIPLALIATDIGTGDKHVLNEGPIDTAVMASTCIPGIFIPVKRDGLLLVDGGIVENVPIPTLRELGAEYIIGVNLNAHHGNRTPRNILEVLSNSFHYTLANATRFQVNEADILIEPDLSEFSFIDTDQVPDLIEAGYTTAREALERALH
jgi:NTE family protein